MLFRSEGLLLITNDGDLAHRLLSPRHHVDKVYYAVVDGELPEDAPRQFKKGITLEDGMVTMPAGLEIKEAGKGTAQVLVTIQEGKFHQVKRMFQAMGCRVTYLKRLSMGPLRLDEGLRPGEYRPLTEEEVQALKQ